MSFVSIMNEQLKKEERELAVNGYLMSLAVFISCMPIPIINLIANIIYFFSHRKQTYGVRWHAYNAMLSQLPLFFINSGTWCLVWRVLWGEMEVSNGLIAYWVIAAILNIGEIVSSVICCVRVSQGKSVNIPIISPLAHILCEKKSWDRWQGGWSPAEPRFSEMAQVAKKELPIHCLASIVVLAAIALGVVCLNLKDKVDWPQSPMESYLEKVVYHSFKSDVVTSEKEVEPLRRIVNHLCEKNGIDSIQVYLVDKDEVNAFAYAGRNLAVYTDLIKACDEENELASVLAHEIAHVEKRHVIQSVKKNLGISIVFTALLGDFADLATMLSSNHFSRESEDEADALAVVYLYQAGVDPNGFPSFMKKILTGTFLDRVSIFSDHPATQKRIDKSLERISEMTEKAYQRILPEETWTQYQELMRKKY